MIKNRIKDTLIDEELELFQLLGSTADKAGIRAYVIGGFVRDKILERPTNDIDVVCLGDGIDFARSFAANFKPALQVSYFKNFGTAMLQYKGWEIEFVGARKESYNKDSRKPKVAEGTLEDDQNRRDFTINAMAFSLNKENYLELIDPFNGINDLSKGKIITPLDPGTTFSDDPLRMMRAIRFSAQLKFSIDPVVKQAIKDQSERLKIVSIERTVGEMQKIMATEKPSMALSLLEETNLLKQFFPELLALKGVEIKNGIGHKDNFYHTLQVLDNIATVTDNIWLRWAALLHDIAKPPTKRFDDKEGWTFHGHEVLGASMVYKIFKRLKLPLDYKMKYVQNLVKLHLRPMTLVAEEVTDSAIRRLLFDAGEEIDDLMTLCRADITSKNEKKIKKYLKNYDHVYGKMKELEEKDKIRNWQPPVSGEVIMETFGIKPSKEVGIIKTAIREAILEGEIRNDYKEAFSFMLDLGRKMGLSQA